MKPNKNKNTNEMSTNLLLTLIRNGAEIAGFEDAARQIAKNGDAELADETFVKCAQKRVRKACAPFFNFDETRYEDLPVVTLETAVKLVQQGIPPEDAWVIAEGLTTAAGDFMKREKRIADRKQRKKTNLRQPQITRR